MIAVCGEALMDLVPFGTGTTYEALPGGSPANTAVALARLGVPVMLLARLSDDGFGRQLRTHLTANRVDLSRAVVAAERSSLAIVTQAGDGSASYRFDLDRTADWQWTADELPALPADVAAVHAGSLALAQPPGSVALEAFLGRCRQSSTISLDPNLRPALLSPTARMDVERWLGLADLVKVSTDDLALLYPGAEPVEVAQRWAGAGPALVVVTMAEQGALAVLSGQVVRRPAVAVTVADTVAAGDTFSAALLDHLFRGGHLGGRLDGLTPPVVVAALDWALRAAAVTCSRVGADPPYAAEL